jgi:hypothetical protein
METEITELKQKRDDMLNYFEAMAGLSAADIEKFYLKLSVINHKINNRKAYEKKRREKRKYFN